MASLVATGAVLVGLGGSIRAWWKRRDPVTREQGLHLGTMAILLFLGLTAGYALVRLHTSASATDSTPARKALLNLVDREIRGSCDTETVGDDGAALARVSCVDDDADITVTYALYADARSLDRDIRTRARTIGIPPGRCLTQRTAFGSYNLSGTPDAGSVLCYSDDRQTRLEWTRDDLLIYGSARIDGDDGRSVVHWWSQGGGVAAENARHAFPDELERRLLEHVPEAVESSCDRSTGFLPDDAHSIVACKPDAGAETVWYSSFDDLGELRKYYKQRGEWLRDVEGNCSRRGHDPARASYDDGHRLCYVDTKEDEAWVEWTDEELLIYSFAWRGDEDLHQLYRWWRQTGGPS